MMTEIENLDKFKLLWVIKLCLKIIYPRYNLYIFLVYIAIKNRLWNIRITKRLHYNMSNINLTGLYTVKVIPDRLHKELIDVTISNKFLCDRRNLVIISYENFGNLSAENLFYKDGHTLWMLLTVPLSTKKKKDELSKHVNDVKRFLKMEKHRQSKDSFKLIQKTTLATQSRMVQIMPSYLINHNELYVTETELSNVRNLFQLPYNIEDFEVKLSPIPNMLIPQIATKATLDLVLNPYDLPDEYISLLLNNYFEWPKCVHKDDIIGISITNKSTDILDYKYLDFIENCDKLYFKCTKLEGEIDTNKAQNIDFFDDNENSYSLPFYIIKGKTELKTGLTVHSKLPTSKHVSVVKINFNSNTKYLDNYIYDACPLGLQEIFNNLQASVLPFVIEEKSSPINLLTSPLLPIFMLSGPSGSGKHLVLQLLAKHNGLNYLMVDSNSVMCSTAKQTESRIQMFVQRAKACAPVIVVLDHFENFGSDAESNEDRRIIDFFTMSIENLYKTYVKYPIIFIALTTASEMKPNISRIFLEKYQLGKPNKAQRYDNLKWLFSVMNLQLCNSQFKSYLDDDESDDVMLKKRFLNVVETIACKTETFSFSNIDNLIQLSLKNSFEEQKLLLGNSESFVEPNLFMIREEDIINALEQMRTLQSQGLDTPKIPKVYWQDIGGLEKLKKELLKTIEFPVKYPHLLKNSTLKRTGILLYGPPGCGKTLVAKAVSTELNISFMSVKGPELLNMYIGQSEENVRKVFSSARASSPCLVFLDEIDALAPRRGAAGDSGGAADRLLSQLLAEIDGVVTGSDKDQSSSLVFIMGATNRPDLLEQSLLRPGRLDKLIYIGPYQGDAEKEKVLTALCRRHKISDDVNLMALCSRLPERCTGADLLQVISGARAAAVRKLVAQVERGDVSESEMNPDLLIINQDDMQSAVDNFKPSITDEELAYYETLSNKL